MPDFYGYTTLVFNYSFMSKLMIAGKEFGSRLFTGTGKFGSNALMREALLASGSELV